MLDCRRLHYIDPTSIGLVAGLHAVAAEHGAQLAIASALATLTELLTDQLFADVDLALEWCEDQLLRAEGIDPHLADLLPHAEQELLAGLDAEVVAAFAKGTTTIEIAAGDVVFDEGDPGDRLFFTISGQVSVRVSVGPWRSKRLATIGPGAAFGEMALVDGAARSTSVVADHPTTCLVLPVADIEAAHPRALTQFHANLARILARRLRLANAEVRALES